MVIRPDPKNIIKQLIAVQKFDINQAIKEQRTQPFDFFINNSKKKHLPPHLIENSNSNKTLKNNYLSFDEALHVVKSYLFASTPIFLKLNLNWPKENYNFIKSNRLPVNPKIIQHSKSPVVMVFAEGEAAIQCKEAGADYVGGIKLLNHIKKYGMIPVDDCFCELKQLPAVNKMAPFLGKYTPSIKKSTAYENIAPFIKTYKQWHYVTLESRDSLENIHHETNDNDIFYNHLTIKLADSNNDKNIFKQQLYHILEQLKACSKPPITLINEDHKPIVHQCKLYAKNAPTIQFDPFKNENSTTINP